MATLIRSQRQGRSRKGRALGESEMVGVMYIRCVPGGAFVAPVTGDLFATWDVHERKAGWAAVMPLVLQRIHRSLYCTCATRQAVPRDGDKRGGEKGGASESRTGADHSHSNALFASFYPMSMASISSMNESRERQGGQAVASCEQAEHTRVVIPEGLTAQKFEEGCWKSSLPVQGKARHGEDGDKRDTEKEVGHACIPVLWDGSAGVERGH